MKKRILVLALFFLFIEGIDLTPVEKEENEKKETQKRSKRDVSSLFARSGDDNMIYGNDIMGHDADVTHFIYRVAPNDNYYFKYKQTDLQEREETGIYQYDPELNMRKLNVSGFYEYIRPDGKKQRVDYVSDDEGFHPTVTVT